MVQHCIIKSTPLSKHVIVNYYVIIMTTLCISEHRITLQIMDWMKGWQTEFKFSKTLLGEFRNSGTHSLVLQVSNAFVQMMMITS